MQMETKNWLDMSRQEMAELCKQWGVPAFRARQMGDWLYKGATIDEMKNLPADLRARMTQAAPTGLPQIVTEQLSALDGTRKVLYRYADGSTVEGVLMHYQHGATLCISSQVGCRMGCHFCASTLGGLERNLTAGEMLGEVLAMERRERLAGRAPKEGRAVHNIVLMGCGEPLDNYEQLMIFLARLRASDGVGMSLRNVSVSTCGLPEPIRSLAQDAPGVNLSISLHAPEDELRRSMMPIAKRHSIAELMAAAREYVRLSGRRVMFEYALVRGVNDTPVQLEQLALLMRNLQCHVNLIPLNPVVERGMEGSSRKEAYRFAAALEERGISTTVRREMGADIDGACGQLRAGLA